MKDDCFGLVSIILHDGYGQFSGRSVKIPMDDFTYIGGGNGAGKTSAITLIAAFYGQTPEKLVNRGSGKYSFMDYYLPSDQSMIVFHYTNMHGHQCAVLSRGESGKIAYRFIEGDPEEHLFSPTGTEKLASGSSVKEMLSWLKDIAQPMSRSLNTILDYRAVIQRSKQLIRRNESDRSKLRLDAERYGLGDANTDLTHLEKITTGLITKSQLMESLKQVVCDSLISQIHIYNKPSISDMKHVLGEVSALNAFKKDIGTYEQCVTDNQNRLTIEATIVEQLTTLASAVHSAKQRLLNMSESIQGIAKEIDSADDEKNTALDGIVRELSESTHQSKVLSNEIDKIYTTQAKYEEDGMPELFGDFQNIHLIRSSLANAKSHLDTIIGIQHGHQSSRDESLKKLQLELDKKRNFIEPKIRDIEASIRSQTELQHSEELALSKQFHAEQSEFESEYSAKIHALNIHETELTEEIKWASNTQQELQPLIDAEASLESFYLQREELSEKIDQSKAEESRAQAERTSALEKFNQQKKFIDELDTQRNAIMQLLHPKDNTVIYELRKTDPDWHQTIGKVLNPELLMRTDLNPTYIESANTLFGWTFNLDAIDRPDAANSEDELKLQLSSLDHQIEAATVRLAELEKTSSKLTNTIRSHDEKRQTLARELLRCELETKNLRSQIQFIKEDNRNLLSIRQNELKQSLSRIAKEIQVAKTQHNDDKQAMREQHGENLLEVKAIWSDKLQNLSEQIERLTEQLNEAKALSKRRAKDIENAFEQALADAGVDKKVLQSARIELDTHKNNLNRIEQNETLILAYSHWLINVYPTVEQLQKNLNESDKRVAILQRQHSEKAAYFKLKISNLREQMVKLKTMHLNTQESIDRAVKVINIASNINLYPTDSEAMSSADLNGLALSLNSLIEEATKYRRRVCLAIDKVTTMMNREHSASHLAKQYHNRISDLIEDQESLGESEKLLMADALELFIKYDIPQTDKAVSENFRLQANILSNYQESLGQIVTAVRSTSKKLHQIMNTGQSIDSLSEIDIKLVTKLEQTESWKPLSIFSKEWRNKQSINEIDISDPALLELAQLACFALDDVKISDNIESMVDMVITMVENGRPVYIRNSADLAGASSNGLSYLAIMVIFKSITTYFYKGKNVAIAWPMDELENVDSSNFSKMVNMLTENNIYLVTATPALSRAKMWAFKNLVSIEKGRVVLLADTQRTTNRLAQALTATHEQELSNVE